MEKEHCDYNFSFGRKIWVKLSLNKFYFSIKFNNIVNKIQTMEHINTVISNQVF